MEKSKNFKVFTDQKKIDQKFSKTKMPNGN